MRIISPTRALILGGGGSTGQAWLAGILGGLAEAGLDVTHADLTVGTSAGSTAAAQLTAVGPAELLAGALTPVPDRPRGRPRPGTAEHLDRTRRIIEDSADAADMRRRLGAAALALAGVAPLAALAGGTPSSGADRWRATVAARLPGAAWPEDRRLLITAVDAGTGEPVVLDRGSGVDLVDAVAASCSSGAAYPVGDRWCIDGGYRRNENADLAAGYGRVLVLSPFGGRSRTPAAWGLQLAAQVEGLRAGGSRVEVVGPTEQDTHLFGVRSMDLSLRPAAARAGAAQGRALADRVGEFWA
ncbi:patatin-like phospholipase family protein [Cellulomonas denverensis]|uniref:Patatin-like phospholipase family protein n=1 Tax=Cellulomonas denverensis TaxID=264297 RepID=A0A7X6KVX7_9CELL|nr:patatin-like phospholipase family protein [Cellulomonas denverensis]NKY23264.1 patatin-like phospholipase family protein [Cellulomonas denverensis]GIG26382.1 patatin [Cellulomonas denverensis]